MNAVIEADKIVKRFSVSHGWLQHQDVAAVRGASVRIEPGQIVGLVGESGCGKTTLARIMVGIEPASEGTIFFRGNQVTTRSDWKRLRRSVQYIFQDPYSSLPPRMTVKEIVLDPLKIHHIGSRSERLEKVVTLLQLVGLSHKDMSRYPSEFSGGQRQRISIARALIFQPDVLICDEITSGLDVSIQAQVLDLLLNLRDELKLAYLFISHDLRVVRYICDEIAVMYAGKVVEYGSVNEVFSNPLHPYTRGLLASIPDHTRPSAQDELLAKISGEPPSPLSIPQGCPFAPRCSHRHEVPSNVDPALREIEPKHWVACHLYAEA
jgi:oligopeptide/dipeptide ABC transporter ATP-binding protein